MFSNREADVNGDVRPLKGKFVVTPWNAPAGQENSSRTIDSITHLRRISVELWSGKSNPIRSVREYEAKWNKK